MDESHDMIDNFSNGRKKPNSDKKCYHCGCVGHMARKCFIKKQGFRAVCFKCLGTGHKAVKCPKKLTTERFKIVETDSLAMQTQEDWETQARRKRHCNQNERLATEDMSYEKNEISKAMLINDMYKSIITNQLAELQQTTSFKNALAYLLHVTFQTDAVKVTSEMSFGCYLAKDIHVPGYLSSCQFTMMDELMTNVTEGNIQIPSLRNSSSEALLEDGGLFLNKGVHIGTFEVLQLLSKGIEEVEVHRKPQVAVISFGSHLRNWDSVDIKLDSIIDSSGPILQAMVHEYGGEVVARELLQDGIGLQDEIARIQVNSDMILLHGDVSTVITEWWDCIGSVTSLPMRSGEEVFFFPFTDRNSGKKKIVFGLPESLDSAVAAFHLLIKPSLSKMMGSTTMLKMMKG